MDLTRTTIGDLLDEQAGVVARRQLVGRGFAPHQVRRLLRRRELVLVHAGVYVAHTGPLTTLQRWWAAVLACWPAALSHDSALRAAAGPGRPGDDPTLVHVAVDEARRLAEPAGVRLHRMLHFAERVQWNHGPPRIRYEDAALDVALAADSEMAALAALASACQSRRTTARRLLGATELRARVPRRTWIDGVLHDIADGTCSVLEHGYLTRVERPHGLPRARRQQRATASCGVVYRDAAYESVVIELDGRLFHDSARQRDRDFERDLDAAVDGRTTARLSWGQVFDRPCATAGKVIRLLDHHGVAVRPRSCGPDCALSGGSVPAGDTNPPHRAA